jgi:hypothetical protein
VKLQVLQSAPEHDCKLNKFTLGPSLDPDLGEERHIKQDSLEIDSLNSRRRIQDFPNRRSAGERELPVSLDEFKLAEIDQHAVLDGPSARVLDRAEATGATSQDGLHTIAGQSRAEKTKATEKELRAGWIAEAGAEPPQLEAIVRQAMSKPGDQRPMVATEAVRSAEAHVFERRSVVDERMLLRGALIVGRGRVTLDDLKTTLVGREGQGSLIRKETEVASREGLEMEKELCRLS